MADDLNALLQANRSSSVLGAIANPQLVNPLAAQNSALQSAAGIYGLRDAQAQEAAGQAFLDSIKNGRPDQQSFMSNLQANPRSAMRALQAGQQGQTLDANTFKLANEQSALVNNGIAAALLADDASLPGAVANQAQRLLAWGLPPERVLGGLIGLSSNPAEMRQQLQRTLVQLQGTSQEGIYGRPVAPNLGGVLQPGVQRPPMQGGGIVPSGGGLPLGLTPEQEAEIVSVPDNNKTLPDGSPNPRYGQMTQITRGDLLRAAGINPANPGGLGTGRPPPSLRNPAVAPQPRPLSTTQSPADTELIKQAGPKFQADIDAGTAAQNQHATLGNMLADTAQFTTGPLASIIGRVRNMAGNLGIPVNVDAQSAKESFNKLAAGLANAQGAGSDARLNVNISANPHEELSPAGVDLVLRQLQGNADYIQAKAKLAQEFPNRGDYGTFQKQAADLDPRVFQITRLTDEQRKTYWKNLDSTAQKQLGAAIKKAKDMGVLGG